MQGDSLTIVMSIVIWGFVAAPACLAMIWLTAGGDCPLRSPVVILKTVVIWHIAGAFFGPWFAFLGPGAGLICHSLLVGALLDRAFDQGVLCGAWCAFGTYAILGMAFIAGQFVLGRYGFAIC